MQVIGPGTPTLRATNPDRRPGLPIHATDPYAGVDLVVPDFGGTTSAPLLEATMSGNFAKSLHPRSLDAKILRAVPERRERPAVRGAVTARGKPSDADSVRVLVLQSEVDGLRKAVASRAVIEQAKGIVMTGLSSGPRPTTAGRSRCVDAGVDQRHRGVSADAGRIDDR